MKEKLLKEIERAYHSTTNSAKKRFSYNNIAFAKESENSVKVIYKQEIVEDSQKTKDIGLSWALSTMYLAQYKDHIFTYQ